MISQLFRWVDVGAIAQLGERLTGSQEVVGSIPTSSTNIDKTLTFLYVSVFFVLPPHLLY